MIVGVAQADLHIPHAQSLKEKRRVVKSLLDRINSRYRASAAEVKYQDLHQRAQLGFALVNSDGGRAQATLDQIRRMLDTSPEAFLTEWHSELIEGPE